MDKVIVIGGGAAGMMAAISAAQEGHKVELFERNEKLGKKIYITGKGRCNVTNACDTQEIFERIITNERFMYSSIYGFSNFDTMDFFERIGCKLKTERGDRVFPVSDKSSDVISSLQREMQRLQVNVHLMARVTKLDVENGCFVGIQYETGGQKRKESGNRVIIATGGLSYPSTGSDGDGFGFAKDIGHEVTKLVPSLVPMNLKGDDYLKMQGLSLKNVELKIISQNKVIFREFGEMLFTHFGVSGPLILSGSCSILKALDKKQENIRLCIDLKPALSFEQLDNRILRDFKENINKDFKNSLDNLLPKKMISVIIERSGIDPDKKVSFITKEERNRLTRSIKEMEFEFASLRGFNEAVITKGGVKVNQVNPSTMESKLVKGVYFAGEVLDIDAVTGGYNLQLAWSTGYLAGKG